MIVFKNVFERDDPKSFLFTDYLDNMNLITTQFGLEDYKEILSDIKHTEDKTERNEKKRKFMPAMDISNENLLSIDLDFVSDKNKIVEKLKLLESCYVIKESVSGNLVAYFKYNLFDKKKEYKFLYYKLWLELTLLLETKIDFLPEVSRLRYLDLGGIHHRNDESIKLIEKIQIENIPYINIGGFSAMRNFGDKQIRKYKSGKA